MTESEGKVNGVDSGIIYDTDIYDALNSYTHDVPFYLGLAREARGPVLELCCGTGRITLHLMRAGIDITGLDFTPSMTNKIPGRVFSPAGKKEMKKRLAESEIFLRELKEETISKPPEQQKQPVP